MGGGLGIGSEKFSPSGLLDLRVEAWFGKRVAAPYGTLLTRRGTSVVNKSVETEGRWTFEGKTPTLETGPVFCPIGPSGDNNESTSGAATNGVGAMCVEGATNGVEAACGGGPTHE